MIGSMKTLSKIETEDMLTTAEFAAQIKATADIVKKYCQRGAIFGAVKAGHSWLIPRDEVARFKRNRRKRGRPPKGDEGI